MESTNITLPGWKRGRVLGKGGFGSVFEIQRDVFGKVERNAMKVISIPQEDGQIEFMRLTGMDDRSIMEHLNAQVKSFLDEYTIMQELRDNPHIVHCYDFQHIPGQDQFHWTLLIRMELLTPLLSAIEKATTEEQIVQLGLDLCDALITCQEHKIIHRDIKPQNIFISDKGSFKLGDFGIAKILEDTSRANTQAGTLMFMAPEVALGQRYDSTVDIYSLGLVLYWLLNHRRGPFLPLPPQAPGFGEDQNALSKRLRGERFKPPANGSPELKRIIMKACSFEPTDRFRTAKEMRNALLSLRDEKTVLDRPIVPPVHVNYVLSGGSYTGGSSYRYFRETRQIGSASQMITGPSPTLEIEGGNFTWTTENVGPGYMVELRRLKDSQGRTIASVFGTDKGKSRIRTNDTEYSVSQTENGWQFRKDGQELATLTKVTGNTRWTPRQKELYESPIMGLAPLYQMSVDRNLSDEEAMLLLSYPMLEFPMVELCVDQEKDLMSDSVQYLDKNRRPVPENQAVIVVRISYASGVRRTEECHYLDEHHNYALPDDADCMAIRVLDEHDNLVEEIWMDKADTPVEDEERVVRYTDALGRDVPEALAEMMVLEIYKNGKLISTERIPISKDIPQAPGGDTIDPNQYIGAQPGMGEAEQMLARNQIRTLADLEKQSVDVIVELVRTVYRCATPATVFIAAEMLRFRLTEGHFPQYPEFELVPPRIAMAGDLQKLRQAPCRINYGNAVDLAEFTKELLLADFSLSKVTDSLVSKLSKQASLPDTVDAWELALVITAIGKVPERFLDRRRRNPREEDKIIERRPLDENQDSKAALDRLKQLLSDGKKDPYDDEEDPYDDEEDPYDDEEDPCENLDVHGKLAMKRQPGPKDREQIIDAEGVMVKFKLPNYINTNGETMVVKNGGRIDPRTGKTGDAHIHLTCESIFYPMQSLGCLIKNLLLFLVFIVYGVFTVVKALLRSKPVLLILAAAVIYFVLRHFNIL